MVDPKRAKVLERRSKRTKWIGPNLFPAFVGFVPNEKNWRATLERLGFDQEPWPPEHGRCSEWTNAPPQKPGQPPRDIVLVTVNFAKAAQHGMSWSAVLGLLLHELIHAKQFVLADIGEKSPGRELETYMVQSMFMQCYGEARREWRKQQRRVKKAGA